jgi:hypothetical protein
VAEALRWADHSSKDFHGCPMLQKWKQQEIIIIIIIINKDLSAPLPIITVRTKHVDIQRRI